MKKLIPIIIVLVVVVGAVVFITNKKSSDKSSSTNSTSSSSNMSDMNSSTSPQPSSSPNKQETNKVTIQNFAFSPANITVKKGTTVTWTNQDSIGHDVKETDGKQGPSSQLLSNGQSYTFTYTTAGTFNYHCSIHPDMTGTVTVTE